MSNWLPRQGKATRRGEKMTQTTIKLIAWLPIYTAIVVTLVLLMLFFGYPGVGR